MQLSLGRKLKVELEGTERVWAVCTGSLRFPRSQVLSACAGKPAESGNELRMPGTMLPGIIKAGSYFTARGAEFWYVTRSHFDCALSIHVDHPRYHRVVLGIEGAHAWAQRINRWIADKGELSPRESWPVGFAARQLRG